MTLLQIRKILWKIPKGFLLIMRDENDNDEEYEENDQAEKESKKNEQSDIEEIEI